MIGIIRNLNQICAAMYLQNKISSTNFKSFKLLFLNILIHFDGFGVCFP